MATVGVAGAAALGKMATEAMDLGLQRTVALKKLRAEIKMISDGAGAPIFEFAHYGIVGNAMQVLPALTAAFRSHLDKRIRRVA
mgnify:CR=1 FL=1